MRQSLVRKKNTVRHVVQRAPYYNWRPLMWNSKELGAFITAFDMAVPKQRLVAMAHNMKQIQDRAEHLADGLDIRTIES